MPQYRCSYIAELKNRAAAHAADAEDYFAQSIAIRRGRRGSALIIKSW
jgi:hypothetical protein